MTPCIVTYEFLIAERANSPPDQETIADPLQLPFTPVTGPAAPRLPPERHVPNSAATMRRRITVALVERLPRCPCCGSGRARGERRIV
jgi:hypothetical protein